MKKSTAIIFTLIAVLFSGCSDTTTHSTGVYMLMDTSGTYTKQLDRAKTIINFLLGTLVTGDTLAVARIDSGSFSEKDIIAKVTFDQRPSVAGKQKRVFEETIKKFIASARGSKYTDITGGILQAVEYLNEANPGRKYILIFSDLQEDLAAGHVRNLSKIDLDMHGFQVVALNVTKLFPDQLNPQKYYDRLAVWQEKVEKRGGKWRKINDLDRIQTLFDE
jgi:hypothetical protein